MKAQDFICDGYRLQIKKAISTRRPLYNIFYKNY